MGSIEVGYREDEIKKFEDYAEEILHSDFMVYSKHSKEIFGISNKRIGQIFFDYEDNSVNERFEYASQSFINDFDDLSSSSKLLVYLDYCFINLFSFVNPESFQINQSIKGNASLFDNKMLVNNFIVSIELLNYIFEVFAKKDQDIRVFLMRYLDFLDGQGLFKIKPSDLLSNVNLDGEDHLLKELDESFETLKGNFDFWKYKYPQRRFWIDEEFPPTSDIRDIYIDMSFEEELLSKY